MGNSFLARIVRTPQGPLLCERGFDDIARGPGGIVSSRPMVCFVDPHEAVEQALWCYEQNMLPLIAESDTGLASYMALAYEIDSLIADPASCIKLLPYLEKRTEPMAGITLVAPAFDDAAVQLPLKKYAKQVEFRTLP